MPAFIPIPECQESCLGQELRTGLKIVCLLVALLSVFPTLIGLACPGNTDPTRYSSLVPLVVSLLVLAVLFLQDVPADLHFVLNCLWAIVAVFILVNFFIHVLHAEPDCRVAFELITIAWAYLSLAFLGGVPAYWSFYVERA